jgi:hypothetical protein
MRDLAVNGNLLLEHVQKKIQFIVYLPTYNKEG